VEGGTGGVEGEGEEQWVEEDEEEDLSRVEGMVAEEGRLHDQGRMVGGGRKEVGLESGEEEKDEQEGLRLNNSGLSRWEEFRILLKFRWCKLLSNYWSGLR